MSGLAADGAVGMPAARGEIVGAYHGGPAGNLAPSANMVGGREARDAALVVIVRKAREAADFAKAAGVEQHVNAFAAGQLAARALAHDPRVLRIGREAAMRDRLQGLHLGQQGSPGLLAIATGRGSVGCARGWSDGGNDLPGRDIGADLSWADATDDAGAGRRDRGLHLHRADD